MRDVSHDRNGGEKSGAGSPSAAGLDGKDSNRPSTGHGHNINGESGRSSKAKTHPARTSLNEMKRRVAAILEFVGRMQTERTTQLAAQNAATNGSSHDSGGSSKGATTPNGLHKSSSESSLNITGVNPTSLPTASLVRAVEAGLKGLHKENARSDKSEEDGGSGSTPLLQMMDEREFSTMGSIDMMETLTRELVQWQSMYGVYSR
jgi:hypothetical protein